MRLFILSFLVSVSAVIMASLPAVKAEPLEMISRICFYFGFPGAILLSIVVIAVTHALQIPISAAVPESMKAVPEADGGNGNGRKAA